MTTHKLLLRRPWRVVFLLILFLLTGCAGSGERVWLNAPDWSRAQRVAMTQDDALVALTTAGDTLLLMTVEDNRPQITAFDPTMTLLWQAAAEETARPPTQLTLIWNEAQQTAHLFWLVEDKLYTQAVDSDGRWLEEEAQWLNEGIALAHYTAAADHSGTIHVWLGGTRREPGVYRLTLADPLPRLVAADGRWPVVFVDEAHTLHAAWFAQPTGIQDAAGLYYVNYPAAQMRAAEPQLIAESQIYSDSVFNGPWMAADRSHLYILWSEAIRSGRALGVVENQYVVIPAAGLGGMARVQEVVIPRIGTTDLPYETVETAGFLTTERVPLGAEASGRREQLQSMEVAQASGAEVALTFRVPLTKERREVSQVAVVYLQNGRPTSYQLLTDTFYSSFNPLLAVAEGDLWVNWVERVDDDEFSVYLASTNEVTRQSLAAVRLDDIGRLSLMTLFGLLLNAVLTPFVFFVWMVPVFFVLLLTMPLWRKDDQLTRRGWIALGLVLLTFWVVKLLTMQGMFAYVPFSQWIPIIPVWLGILLQIIVPLAVPLGAAWVAWRYGRRADFQPVLTVSIIYILLDTLGTMTFYGELLYNAF